MYRRVLSALVATALVGCPEKKADSPQALPEPVEQPVEATPAQEPPPPPANPKPNAVSWRALLALLPDSVGDWKAADPGSGETTSAGDVQITEVERTYGKGALTAKVKVVDSIMEPAFPDGMFKMASGSTVDASDHFLHGFIVSGHPAYEEWRRSSRGGTGTVAAFVGGRFIVSIESANVPDTKELVALLGKLELGKLHGLPK